MKKLATCLILILFVFCSFAQRISLQPSILDFHLGPSATQSQSISISNLSDKKIAFQAYLADWLRDSVGGHQYFRPDTLSRSCASWVRLNKNFLEIEPGKTEELIIQLQAPEDVAKLKQMKWAMLFLQSTEEQDANSKSNKQLQTQIKELIRIGVHIYQTPPTIHRHAAKAISLKAVEKEKNTYEFTMQNVGDVMLQSKAHLELTNVETGKEFKLNKTEFPVFPEGTRKVKFTIPDTIPAGKYSALAILDIGEDMPLEAVEKVIEVK